MPAGRPPGTREMDHAGFMKRVESLANSVGSQRRLLKNIGACNTLWTAWANKKSKPTYHQVMCIAFNEAYITKKDIRVAACEWLTLAGITKPITFEKDLRELRTKGGIYKTKRSSPPPDLLSLPVTSTELNLATAVLRAMEETGVKDVSAAWLIKFLQNCKSPDSPIGR